MTVSPVSLPDAVRLAILSQLNNIHTALPGQIVSYDYTTQKATIQPTVSKAWTDGTSTVMPILNSVPVIFPQAGGASLTFPVNVGDPCLILCCERSIDEWLASGNVGKPADPRKFALSDAVAIMGLMPFNSTFPTRSNNTDLILEYAGSAITITSTGAVKINTATTLALGKPDNELINQLLTVLTKIGLAFAKLQSTGVGTPETGQAATACTTAVTNLTALDGTLP